MIKGTAQEGDKGDALDSKELGMLQEAGILPSTSNRRRKSNHIIFAENDEEAQQLSQRTDVSLVQEQKEAEPLHEPVDLGWKTPKREKNKKKKFAAPESNENDTELNNIDHLEAQFATPSHRSRTHKLKELSARLMRSRQLRYAQRELEMQRLMMGKGARKKISGVEKLEGDEEDEDEDEDEMDARRGKQRKPVRKVDETTYKPRVYKWRLERKH